MCIYLTKEILLRGKYGDGKVALVDDDDYEYLSKFKWWLSPQGYVRRVGLKSSGEEKSVLMHREIVKCPDGLFVDHINHNTIDNRKRNLRICTPKENSRNKNKESDSKNTHKGVKYKNDNYEASIVVDGTYIFIGSFTNEIAAANAYNYHAIMYFGEFACLNEVEHMEKEEWENYMYKDTSKYNGVSFNKRLKKWNCDIYIKSKKKTKYVGVFDSEVEAAIIFNQEMYKMYGNDFNINVIEGVEDWSSIEVRKYKDTTYSKYYGITYDKRRNVWLARVYYNKKQVQAGTFDDEIKAVKAYNEKALELFGEKAKLNIIEGE